MNNKHSHESGLTLIELLAVLALMSIISFFLVPIVIQSTETTREIQIQNSIRDEADLIVSKLVKSLYETNKAHIIQNQTGTGYSYLNITNDPSKCKKDNSGAIIVDTACINTFKKIGFVTTGGITKLVLKDEEYEVMNKNISILSDSKIIGDPTSAKSYEISLKLQYKSNRKGNNLLKTIEFKNIIQPY
ncbi:type II secretion system protein [Neobacillus niacini]|uniref:type II secretion system protein n=1 Tax=Neobacillus niacini TaxID=86668 RepID=UPI0021CB4035|nr:prepilin-type N-terminal cleavage/methylation domain-containing protein [Neobacillus niacini]MCM3765457.1 prepilin-type N-terminal cleavage/methylation domain-containing protein [Neobacillus niacini]